MKKFDFGDYTFYIGTQGDGPISSQTVGVTKFYKTHLCWNRRYNPDKVNKQFLQTLI